MSRRRAKYRQSQLIEAMEPRQLLTAADVVNADLMVSNITDANNTYSYNLPPTVTLTNVSGGTMYNNSSDCSTFITSLLEQSYSLTSSQIDAWTGSTWPQASDLYTAAKNDSGFTGFMQIGDVVPGDLMFIKYNPETTDTGHCVMFDKLPTLVSSSATERAYNAVVIDCTGDPHSSDTRNGTGVGGADQSGVGRGTMRLYTDQYGNLTNYSWGTSSQSQIQGPTDPKNYQDSSGALSYRSPIFAKAPVSSADTGTTWLAAGSQATFNSATNALTVTGATAIVADPNNNSLNVTVSGSAGQLLIMPGAVSTVHMNSLTVTGGATATLYDPNSGALLLDIAANVSTPGVVSIDSSSTLDMQDNDMLIHAGSVSTITASVKSGFNNAKWTGHGIISSIASADTTHLTTLGVMLNSVDGTTPIYPTFDNKTAGATAVLVKYTYFGDANIDGKVDGSDYTKIDSAYVGGHVTGWANGDLNYDGVVNGSDYTLIDNAFNTQGKQILFSTSAIVAASAVPAKPTTAVAFPATTNNASNPDLRKKTRPLILSLNL